MDSKYRNSIRCTFGFHRFKNWFYDSETASVTDSNSTLCLQRTCTRCGQSETYYSLTVKEVTSTSEFQQTIELPADDVSITLKYDAWPKELK